MHSTQYIEWEGYFSSMLLITMLRLKMEGYSLLEEIKASYEQNYIRDWLIQLKVLMTQLMDLALGKGLSSYQASLEVLDTNISCIKMQWQSYAILESLTSSLPSHAIPIGKKLLMHCLSIKLLQIIKI